MTLAERVVALHGAFAEGGIPHAFGGAIALAYATLDPRGTSDIDCNVFLPAAEAAPAIRALPDGIARPGGLQAAIAREGQVRLWWDETPVDLFFDYAAIHSRAAAHSRRVPFEDVDLPVLGPIELVVFKVMFDRSQDWVDIEAVVEAGTVDMDAVRTELADLLDPGDQRLERLSELARGAT